MAERKQGAFLLKVGNGETPPVYGTIAGLRTIEEAINESGMQIVGSGVFTGYHAEERLKRNAASGDVDDYRLSFETGQTWTGRFKIAELAYAGDFNGERSYRVSLESVGKVALS